MAASRRDAYYAAAIHHTNQNYHNQVDTNLLCRAQSVTDVYNAFHGNRYYKINVCSWQRHSTIEFRQHSGTTNFEKIRMWSLFCLKLVAWSADNRLRSDVRTIDDIPFLNNREKEWFKQRAIALAGANE